MSAERKRYVYRVIVERDGAPVVHYQTRRAAQHKAVAWSGHYLGAVVRVDRSLPVVFEPTDEQGRPVITVIGYYRNAVRF